MSFRWTSFRARVTSDAVDVVVVVILALCALFNTEVAVAREAYIFMRD